MTSDPMELGPLIDEYEVLRRAVLARLSGHLTDAARPALVAAALDRAVVVQVDDAGQPTALDGTPLEPVRDPRYPNSTSNGVYVWRCPEDGCDFRFEQGIDVLVPVWVTHRRAQHGRE